MAENKDYIPARDDDFNQWATNFRSLTLTAPTAYGLTTLESNQISVAVTAWQAAYAAATNGSTRSPATIAQKNATRAQATAIIRPLAVRIILNPSVSNAQREQLGVTVRTGSRTPTPPINTAPSVAFVSAIPLVSSYQYRDQMTPDSKQKPKGVTTCQVFVATGTLPAIDPAQATYRTAVNKTPFVIQWSPSEQGKIATIWTRWFAPAGPGGVSQVGPWSAPLIHTVI